MQILSIIIRLIIIVLFITDIRMTKKLKSKDSTLKRSLSKMQKGINFTYYFIVSAGILVPFDNIYLPITIFALIFFFIYTDKEIYVNTRSMYFRARYFEFKKIKNFTYENHTFEFDYDDEHIRLKRPFLEEGMIQRDIVYRIEKAATKAEHREKRRK